MVTLYSCVCSDVEPALPSATGGVFARWRDADVLPWCRFSPSVTVSSSAPLRPPVAPRQKRADWTKKSLKPN